MQRLGHTAEDISPLVEQYEARTQTAAAFCVECGILYAQPNYGRATYHHQRAAFERCVFVEISRPAASAWAQVCVGGCWGGGDAPGHVQTLLALANIYMARK